MEELGKDKQLIVVIVAGVLLGLLALLWMRGTSSSMASTTGTSANVAGITDATTGGVLYLPATVTTYDFGAGNNFAQGGTVNFGTTTTTTTTTNNTTDNTTNNITQAPEVQTSTPPATGVTAQPVAYTPPPASASAPPVQSSAPPPGPSTMQNPAGYTQQQLQAMQAGQLATPPGTVVAGQGGVLELATQDPSGGIHPVVSQIQNAHPTYGDPGFVVGNQWYPNLQAAEQASQQTGLPWNPAITVDPNDFSKYAVTLQGSS